jgi:hypothetical protein
MQMILCETTNPYGDQILRPISGEAMKWFERTSTKIEQKAMNLAKDIETE